LRPLPRDVLFHLGTLLGGHRFVRIACDILFITWAPVW
jgi:hypothetical protein